MAHRYISIVTTGQSDSTSSAAIPQLNAFSRPGPSSQRRTA